MATLTAEDVRGIEPEVRPAANGGWLAVSQAGSGLRIAVIGESEEAARTAFRTSIEEWARLRAMPEAEWQA